MIGKIIKGIKRISKRLWCDVVKPCVMRRSSDVAAWNIIIKDKDGRELFRMIDMNPAVFNVLQVINIGDDLYRVIEVCTSVALLCVEVMVEKVRWNVS